MGGPGHVARCAVTIRLSHDEPLGDPDSYPGPASGVGSSVTAKLRGASQRTAFTARPP